MKSFKEYLAEAEQRSQVNEYNGLPPADAAPSPINGSTAKLIFGEKSKRLAPRIKKRPSK